ncbi:MAG: hypothetical protein GW939_04075 [Candidatus Magasanikbacteria bacterium]|nr:hypothetical protein [Candidatus Magasanikbacteria bacterium]NCS71925.1 hypothetical protein [Candidatus Magasanikbacteria bacterium]
MANIDRLITLAQKTGNTIIVHTDNEEKNDVVILDIDKYEELVMNNQSSEVSSENRKKIEQINNELAALYAQYEMEGNPQKEDILAKEIQEQGDFDPFEQTDYKENLNSKQWEEAANILEHRYSHLIQEEPPVTNTQEDEEMMERYTKTVEEEHGDHSHIRHVPLKQSYAEMSWEQQDNKEGEDPIFLEEPVL